MAKKKRRMQLRPALGEHRSRRGEIPESMVQPQDRVARLVGENFESDFSKSPNPPVGVARARHRCAQIKNDVLKSENSSRRPSESHSSQRASGFWKHCHA